MAGDGMHFKKTLVLHRDKWMEKGAVGVVLDSISLRIHKNYHLSWKPIGKMMEITKASSCRVWEIDNRPVCEVYQKYLGEEIARNMPHPHLFSHCCCNKMASASHVPSRLFIPMDLRLSQVIFPLAARSVLE